MPDRINLITVGEPAGIGPDCILLAWQAARHELRDCCICAPAEWLAGRANALGLDIDVRQVAQPQASGDTLNCWNPLSAGASATPVQCGAPSAATASAVIGCIRAAAEHCLQHPEAAMVTGPIEKAVLHDSGFDFPGHTEFLAHLAGDAPFVMMLASEALRVALLTTHMAIADVPAALNARDTLQAMRIVHTDLQRRFGIEKPRLALCGLNPHAGEAGHFGREEIEVLQPAVRQAAKAGIHVTGPLPADSLFSAAMRRQFDAVICCYHDQGLIPIKALSFGDAVNITLGLPFVRTSVDHGTALARAGSGEISYTSLLAAIAAARSMRRAMANRSDDAPE